MTSNGDLQYEEARRQARMLLGPSAEVFVEKGKLYPVRVGVWMKNRFILVGAGQTFTEALADARSRQHMMEE